MVRSLLILISAALLVVPASTHAGQPVAQPPVVLDGDNADSEDENCDDDDDDNNIATSSISFRVVNNHAPVAISGVLLLHGEEDDCEVLNASAPAGWSAQRQQGYVTYWATSAGARIASGHSLGGFRITRSGDQEDCCMPLLYFGPDGTQIHDDDDEEDDCFCSRVPVTPTNWGHVKVLFR